MIAIRFHPAARREILRAFEWYLQEASQHIAAGFLDDFEQTLALLRNHPEIVATAHHSRHPEYWAGR